MAFSHDLPRSSHGKLIRTNDATHSGIHMNERPSIEDYPYTDISSFLIPVQSNMVIKCEDRTWNCHKEILCPRCSFFEICCYSGFEESGTCKIKLVDDNPSAIEALLRYLYTLDFNQMFADGHHVFEDVELDLDVWLVADKYEVLLLRKYMESKISLFYNVLQRPQNRTRKWDERSQQAFARVLRKLYALQEDTTVDTQAIRSVVVHFIVVREKTVMQWPDLITVIEEYVELSNDIIKALLVSRRALQTENDELKREVLDLNDEVERLQDENYEQYGDLENLQGLLDGEMYNFYPARDEYDYEDQFCWE